MFGNAAAATLTKSIFFLLKLNMVCIFWIKIKYGLYVLDRFDMLISKIIFKK